MWWSSFCSHSCKKSLIAKAAVGAQQRNRFVPELLQSIVEKRGSIVGGVAIIGAQPAIGDYAYIRHKGHQPMMGDPLDRVVLPGLPLLDGRIGLSPWRRDLTST
ncbi:MAG: hypothetical protein ACYDDO_14940, partial [Acidiferrobacterales bacterium]